MWRRGLYRAFAETRKRDEGMRKRLWQYAGIYAGFVGFVYLSFKSYSTMKDPQSKKSQRTEEMVELALQHPVFTGVPRDRDMEEVLNKLHESIVILYHPSVAGKSQLISYLRSTSQRPVLVIEGKDTLIQTLQQFPIKTQISELNTGKFQEMIGAVLKSISEKKPILVLDGMEKAAMVLVRILCMLGYKMKMREEGDLLVATNSIKVLALVKNCGESQVHILSDLEKGEFLAVAAQIGVSTRDAELLYEECGPSLELLLEAHKQESFSAYPAKVRAQIKEALGDALRTKPHLRDAFRSVLATISPATPYGDFFAGTEAARLLAQLQLASEFPNGSTRFRNKLAISVLQSVVSSE